MKGEGGQGAMVQLGVGGLFKTAAKSFGGRLWDEGNVNLYSL